MSAEPSVAVAIAVHNEAEVLPRLLTRLRAVLDAIGGGPHQMVFVDDGSSDDTVKVLETAAREDSRITVIVLARNFGHQAALTAALDHVTSDVTIVMDADLQDPPEAIPTLLERYHQGFDVVYAQRIGRKETLALRLSYVVFYRLIAGLADVALPLDAGDFGLMSRRVVEHLRSTRERHRYLRGLRSWVGFRQTGVPVERGARAAGRSKYSVLGLIRLASDGLFAFSTAPLKAASLIGLGAIAASLVYAAYSVYAKFVLHRSPQGFTALVLIITFLSGVNLLFLGIIGEYLGRVYEEVKARPIYVIDRMIGRTSRQGRVSDGGAPLPPITGGD
jgi:glycosyltransferase involved in cell wall biosynthesis